MIFLLSRRALPARPPKELAVRHTIAAIEPFERSLDRDRRVYPQLVAKATTLAKEAIPMRVEEAHENWLLPLAVSNEIR